MRDFYVTYSGSVQEFINTNHDNLIAVVHNHKENLTAPYPIQVQRYEITFEGECLLFVDREGNVFLARHESVKPEFSREDEMIISSKAIAYLRDDDNSMEIIKKHFGVTSFRLPEMIMTPDESGKNFIIRSLKDKQNHTVVTNVGFDCDLHHDEMKHLTVPTLTKGLLPPEVNVFVFLAGSNEIKVTANCDDPEINLDIVSSVSEEISKRAVMAYRISKANKPSGSGLLAALIGTFLSDSDDDNDPDTSTNGAIKA